MNLFYQPLIGEGKLQLDAEESRHCVKVLRKRAGDTIHITDGKGFFYHATITLADAVNCIFSINEKKPAPQKDYSIHIAIAPTKNPERIEWFVEKTVEIGVDEISLIECANGERSFLKGDRLNKIAVSAMKQSLKAYLPVLHGMRNIASFMTQDHSDEKFIACVDHDNERLLQNSATPKRSYSVLIGPEGDFSPAELQQAMERGYVKVSLGKSRLRTETAGMVACSMLNLIQRY